jgi:hypothetical protein
LDPAADLSARGRGRSQLLTTLTTIAMTAVL